MPAVPEMESNVIGKLLARKGILSKREQELRAREQELLQRLASALERFGTDVAPDDLRRFQEAVEPLLEVAFSYRDLQRVEAAADEGPQPLHARPAFQR